MQFRYEKHLYIYASAFSDAIIVWRLTWTSHIRTLNLACTDFQHCLANIMGAIYEAAELFISTVVEGQTLFAYVSYHLFVQVQLVMVDRKIAHPRDTSRLYCLFKKSVWACSGQMRCDSRGFEIERRVCGRERSTTKTDNLAVHDWVIVWKMYNVKLCIFKSRAVGIICANHLI